LLRERSEVNEPDRGFSMYVGYSVEV
jgi:hypothetical protein